MTDANYISQLGQLCTELSSSVGDLPAHQAGRVKPMRRLRGCIILTLLIALPGCDEKKVVNVAFGPAGQQVDIDEQPEKENSSNDDNGTVPSVDDGEKPDPPRSSY